MLYSITIARATGSPQLLAVPEYISKDHITATVDAVPTTGFEWINPQTIRITAGINRELRVIRSSSPGTRLSTYMDGQGLPANSLELDSKQAFYLAQEARDLAVLGGSAAGNPTPGLELTQQGLLDLLIGQITPSQLELFLRTEIAKISAADTIAGSVGYRVAAEALARANAVQAEADARAAALLQEATNRGAAITTAVTTLQAADTSLAQSITTLTAAVGTNAAGIQTEATARVTGDTAVAQAVTTLAGTVGTLSGALTTEQAVRLNSVNVVASSVETLRASVQDGTGSIAGRITNIETAQANATDATAVSVRTGILEAKVDIPQGQTVLGRLTTVDTASVNRTSAVAQRVSDLESRVDMAAGKTVEARITDVYNASANLTSAVAQRASLLEAKVNLNPGQTITALINDEATARATADNAFAQSISTLQSSVSGAGGVVSRLATVEQQATTQADKVIGVESQWTIKVQARSDGKKAIAGIGLNATANSTVTQSEMVFLAGSFKFVPDTDTNGIPQPLFMAGLVNGISTFVIPSTRMGDNLVESRMVVEGGIQARHLRVTSGAGLNVWADSTFLDQTAWRPAAWGGLPDSVPDSRGNCMRSTSGGGQVSARGARRVPVVVGRRYRVSADVWATPSANGTLYIRVDRDVTVTGAYYEDFIGIEGETVISSNGWKTYSGEWVATFPYASPMVLLNYSSTAGEMYCTNIRIAEMVGGDVVIDNSLTVAKIDTRGLTIRDAAGNLLFGAGQNLAYSLVSADPGWQNSALVPSINSAAQTASWAGVSSRPTDLAGLDATSAGKLGGIQAGATVGASWSSNISGQPTDAALLNSQQQWGQVSGTGRPADNATVGATIGSNLSGQFNAGNITTFMADATIGNAQIRGDLFSINYVSGVSGWCVYRSGNAEFYNVKVRGDIEATSLNGVIVGEGNISPGAVSASSGVTMSGPLSLTQGTERVLMTATVVVPSSTATLYALGECAASGNQGNSSWVTTLRLYIDGVLSAAWAEATTVTNSGDGSIDYRGVPTVAHTFTRRFTTLAAGTHQVEVRAITTSSAGGTAGYAGANLEILVLKK